MAAESSLNVHLSAAGRMPIVNFPPVAGSESVLEIHSPEGSVQTRESLTPGQKSVGWNFAGRPKDQYLSVLQDGGKRLSRPFTLVR